MLDTEGADQLALTFDCLELKFCADGGGVDPDDDVTDENKVRGVSPGDVRACGSVTTLAGCGSNSLLADPRLVCTSRPRRYRGLTCYGPRIFSSTSFYFYKIQYPSPPPLFNSGSMEGRMLG